MRLERIYPLFIAVITVTAFAAACSFGLVNYDDYQYVVDGAKNYGFCWAFSHVGDAMWTPLTYLSYWLDRTLFFESWGAYHAHNIFWHAINAVLLYEVLMSLTAGRHALACLLAALIWSVHPLRVESVVWIAGRKDVLSTFFFLSALLCWIRSSGTLSLISVLFFLVLGGMSKSSVMVFPAFALAVDALILRRFRPWWAYVLLALLSFALAVEAGWAQNAGGACTVADEIPLAYRILNAFCSLTVYCHNLVFPRELAAQCQLRYPQFPRFEFDGLLIMVGASWYCVRRLLLMFRERVWRCDIPLAGLAAGFGSFIPFLGIAGFGTHAFADRFTLLPSVGFAIALLGFYLAVERRSVRRICCVGGGIAAVLLARQTLTQTSYWRDGATLFEHTLSVDGNGNLLAHKALLVHYWEFPHDMQKVYEHVLPALTAAEWQQDWISVLGYMGVEAAFETGRPEEARDICAWVYRMTGRQLKEVRKKDPSVTTSTHYLIAEAVRLAYTDDCLELAREKLGDLEGRYGMSDNIGVRNLRYVIARRGGNPAEIAAARANLYVKDGDSAAHNRWAKRWFVDSEPQGGGRHGVEWK